MMKIFSELKKNLKKDFSELTTIKVALLADSAPQFLAIALRGAGYDAGSSLLALKIIKFGKSTKPFLRETPSKCRRKQTTD
jgi:hypothetical protein